MLNTPTKITLKNTTKMSLNARFTTIMKTRPPTSTQTVRAQVTTDRLASEKNRRLAQQMEKRSAQMTAVPSSSSFTPPAAAAKTSVLARLGQRTIRGNKPRGRGFVRGANRGSLTTINRNRGNIRGRLNLRGKITRGGQRGGFRGRGGGRGGRGRGGRGGRGGAAAPSKDRLDTDLDSYMSKTKGSMDAELDSYMKNSGKA